MIRKKVLLAFLMTLSQPTLAATFVVDSLLDTPDSNINDGVCEATSGGTQCTLRAAIQQANASAGFDVITFSVGLSVINVTGSALPAITSSLRIDGSTAPSYNGAASTVTGAPPSVYIDGDGLGGAAVGFNISTSENVEIVAMGITGFPSDGILVVNNQSCLIDSNWIGVTRGGSSKANGRMGIYLQDTQNCVIGQEIVGTSIQGRGNVISDNVQDGVHISSGANNIVSGNFIGLDPLGPTDHGNGRHGIYTAGANDVLGQIRTAAPALATGNLIGNNGADGIRALATVTIFGNYVFENAGAGIRVSGNGSTLGNISTQSRNIVEANGNHGILITHGSLVSNVVVRKAWVFANAGRGIQVEKGSGIQLIENEIWDNIGDAVGLAASGSSVWGNKMGAALAGLPGNGGSGVVIEGSNNTVSGNDIGALDADGIDVLAGSSNQLLNNRIGTDAAFLDAGNAGNGIRLRTAAQNTLVQGNLIGHNGASGIFSQGADGTEIMDNRIGSGAAGEPMGNAGSGINIDANSTDARVISNVIGHNLLDGILLDGGSAEVCENWIGVGQGLQDAGNAVEGIRLRGFMNHVGDPALPCPGNHIGFNNSDGIQLEGESNVVRDNFIGGKVVDGTSVPFGNSAGGVLLTAGAGLNTIRGNVLRHNGSHGVRVSTTAGVWNALRMNDFRFNGGMAVDLNLDGVTPNDPGDYDSGPNDLQNTPEFDLVEVVNGELKITYRVDSVDGAAVYPIVVDFYVSEDNEREGSWVAQSIYTTPTMSWTRQFNPGATSGYVMAMATDANGNSSELGEPVPFEVPLPAQIFANGFED